MASTQWNRIEAYCKIIWGAERSYYIDDERRDDPEDDNYYYFMVIREDRGTSLGNALTTTGMIKGKACAWNEMENHVASLAKTVKTEGWVPKVQPLDVAAYPSPAQDFSAKAQSLLSLLKRNKTTN